MPIKPTKRATKKKPAEKSALVEELEEIEAIPAQPLVTAESVERALTSPTVAKAVLPTRGDESRVATVKITPDDNGTSSHLTIEGAGIGAHETTTRVWPDDQMHTFTFDGDTFSQTLEFIATHAIVVIDGGDEIRVGTAPTD